LEAVFFAYMHKHGICPLTHAGIGFYFGVIYERKVDRKDWFSYYERRDDLNNLVEEARELKANDVPLAFNRGIPFIA
jgi:hypothetical protein